MIMTIDGVLCVGCGNCDSVCPMDVIYMNIGTRKAEIKYVDDCQTCFNCEVECPTNAIFVDPTKKVKPRAW